MTRFCFCAPVGVILQKFTFISHTVPRIGELIHLRALGEREVLSFKVKNVSWYEAKDPHEGMEAEIELTLNDEWDG